MAQATKATRPNWFSRIPQYIRDVRSEMKRVVWPTRQEVLNSSLIVLVTLVFFIVFTTIVDYLSTVVVGAINSIGG